MNCSETKFVMSLYLSSELDVTRMADFELHVQRCGSCARELEYARHCDELLRDAYREQPIDTLRLRERVLSEVSKSKPRRRFSFRRPVYSLPIAAILLLAIAVGIAYFTLHDGAAQTVYAAALDDHYNEVVQHPPIGGWRETRPEIEAFVRQQLGDADFLDKLAPADYHLKRARLCDLPDKAYVHLVYNNDAREISIYVRRKDVELPGPTVETVNGCALHATAINKFEIAGFQSQRYTVLVVSDLPRAESLRLVRVVARQIAG
jgi:anti-sigma factor RsiW